MKDKLYIALLMAWQGLPFLGGLYAAYMIARGAWRLWRDHA